MYIVFVAVVLMNGLDFKKLACAVLDVMSLCLIVSLMDVNLFGNE